MESSLNFLFAKRVILYIRVSTDEQAKKGYSLPVQMDQLKKFCLDYGLQIVLIFQEDASAKTFDRPEFNKFLNFVQKNKNAVDYLLVVKWDRFSRNTADAYEMINRLSKMEIIVNSTEQWIDFSIPEQDYMLSFYITHAHVENKIRSNRTKMGMRRARKEGNWIHQAPKGYKFVPDPERTGKNFLVLSDEATFIQEAFGNVSTGIYSVNSILKMLIQKGFKCSRTQFYRLLRNKIYIGKIFISASKDTTEEVIQGNHQPIISEELFCQVQEVLKGVRKTRIRVNPYAEHYPLKGFLLCSNCKRSMTGNPAEGNGGIYYYYQCQKRGCSKSLLNEKVHSAFLEYLRGIKVAPEIAVLYCRIMKDIFKNREKYNTGQNKQFEVGIARLEERLISMDNLFIDQKLDETSYQRAKRNCEAELRQAQIKKLEYVVSESSHSKYLSFGMSMLSNIDVYYETASVEVKRKIIGLITPKKVVFSENEVQTVERNETVALLSRFSRDVQVAKRKQVAENGDLFRLVTPRGELSNQFYEELNKMFNLRHHLKVDPLTPEFAKELNRIYKEVTMSFSIP